MTTANDLIMGAGGARSASFKEINDQFYGTIISSKVQQQRDIDGKAKFYDDGNPMMQVVITLLTDLHEDEDDDSLRAVYAKGEMLKAIRAAVVKAGARGIADGGQLVVRYIRAEPPIKKGYSPTKIFFAKYAPPHDITELPEEEPHSDYINEDDLPF